MQKSNKSANTMNATLDNTVDKTHWALNKLNELTKEKEALYHQEQLSLNYTKEELETLSYFFNCEESAFTPLADKSTALSIDELISLVNQGNYGCLKDFKNEFAQQVMTNKQFLTAAMAAMCDDKSYFTYDSKSDTLYCNIVDCGQQVALRKGEDLFTLNTADIKATAGKEKSETLSAFDIVHTYLFYLSMINKLDCEDEVSKLFLQKDTYKDFFAEVIKTLSQIFVLGLNNINYDVSEKVKALYIQSASYRIEFLRKALNKLYTMLQNTLDDRTHANLNGAFNLICKIINTVEAMKYQSDRDKLITLYGLNEGHEYVVKNIPVVGCGYNCFDFSNSNSTNQSYRYYFYDFVSKRFLVIKTVVTDYFSSPNVLFEVNSWKDTATRCHVLGLDKASRCHLTFLDAFVVDNKVTNSQHSTALDHCREDKVTSINEDGSKEEKAKFGDGNYQQDLKRLYDIFAFTDFTALKELVYETSGQYFVPENQTQTMHVIKVHKLNAVNNFKKELMNVEVEDSQGNKLLVYLHGINSNTWSLIDLFNDNNKRLENFYMLIQCPILSGVMRPTLVTYFGLASNNGGKNKRKKKW